MSNIPANKGATLLVSGQSLSGSFQGFTVFPSSSISASSQVADFTGLKDGNGSSLISGSDLFVLAGMTVWLTVTSASLGANSANVLLYNT